MQLLTRVWISHCNLTFYNDLTNICRLQVIQIVVVKLLCIVANSYQYMVWGNPKHGLVELISIVINIICNSLCAIMWLCQLLLKLCVLYNLYQHLYQYEYTSHYSLRHILWYIYLNWLTMHLLPSQSSTLVSHRRPV